MRTQKVLRILGLLVFLFGGVALAQVSTGTISGSVRDSSGAALAGVKVEIHNDDTGISRIVETNADGLYTAPLLILGNYRVTATLQGFQTELRSGIVLTVGQTATVDLSLRVGSVDQKVTVSGEAPMVESTTAALGSLVDDQEIRALPLNGRSWDQLALIEPNVILTNNGPTSGTPFNYGTGDRFSVLGQRPVFNSFLLDGTDVNDQGNGTPGGATGTNLGVDTILEFNVFTNSFKAEYGHSSGSVISAVTRSGTNTFHGTAFEYLRNSDMDARNYFDVGSSPPPFRRNQFGGVLGGPIKKDKTFFFVGYEGLRQGLDDTLFATVPTALARQGILPTGTVPVNPAITPYLNLYPLPNGRDFGDGSAQFVSAPTIASNEDYVMARVDHRLNANTSVFVRYTLDQDSVNTPGSIPELSTFTSSRRQYTTLDANSVLGPNTLNSFRFAYNRTESALTNNFSAPASLSFIPGEPMGTISIGAIGSVGSRPLTTLGPPSSGNAAWPYNVFEWGDDFSYITGRHSFKVGTDIQRLRDNQLTTNSLLGSYTFSTFTSLLAGTPSNLQSAAPLGFPELLGLRQTLFAAYGQDDYKVNSRLTLNLGLRWEAPTDPTNANGDMAILPSPSATATVTSDSIIGLDKMNFEPRFGLAWQLTGSGKSVLRLGGGIYHNQILPWLYWNNIALPPFFGRFSINNPPFPNGYELLTAPVSATGNGKLALNAMTPDNNHTPVTYQYNLTIEQEIFRNTVVQVSYAGARDNYLPIQREADTAVHTICSTSLDNCPAGLPNGTIYYPVGSPRQNPAWNGIKLYGMDGNAIYNSGTVTLRRRSSSGFEFEVFYTLSKSLDDSSTSAASNDVRSPGAPLDPFDINRDWGLSDFDVRNAGGGHFTFPLPFRARGRVLEALVNGWAFDGIVTLQSGMPFTPVLSASVSRDLSTEFAERPDLVPGFSNNPIHGVSAGCPGFPAGTRVGTPANWYNPCAFTLPVAGTYGDLGRNTIIGPGQQDMDVAVHKTFRPQERTNVEFRAECFNVANHANFGLPNTLSTEVAGTANPAAGQITNTLSNSRQLQFALRLSF